MKQNKDTFKCIYEMENVYGGLVFSIWFFLMAIFMVLLMIIEKIYGITVVLCSIFSFFSFFSLGISLFSRDKKFVINLEECKIESKKGILFTTKLQSIRRIVILKVNYGKQYIILDCEEYPFLAGQDLLFHKVFCIKYTSHRLKAIRKYCSHCRVDKERTNYYVTEKRD